MGCGQGNEVPGLSKNIYMFWIPPLYGSTTENRTEGLVVARTPLFVDPMGD